MTHIERSPLRRRSFVGASATGLALPTNDPKFNDPANAISGAAKQFEAEYTTSINIHCPLEPMKATGDYTPLRMSEMPELGISIIANNDPPSGCGEPAVKVVAPPIANAIFNAVSVRAKSLPVTQAAVRKERQAKKT